MPYSLRFVGVLFVYAFVAAVASMAAQYRRTQISSRLFAEPLAQGKPTAGKAAIERYRCGACHLIRGVSDARGSVGPSLDRFALRRSIDGRLTNDPDTLVRWIREPKAMDPAATMPDQRITEKEARDIAAYLYTRR